MRVAWLCVIVGLTSGCAFVTREVRLEAPEPLVLSTGQPVCVEVQGTWGGRQSRRSFRQPSWQLPRRRPDS